MSSHDPEALPVQLLFFCAVNLSLCVLVVLVSKRSYKRETFEVSNSGAWVSAVVVKAACEGT